MHSFEDGTMLLRQTVTMLRSRDVIHRGPPLFLYMIHVSVSIIILTQKKKALLFDSPSYYLKPYNFVLKSKLGDCSRG